MARRAGRACSRTPVGLARRSRRVLAAACLAVLLLVFTATISGAKGGKDGPDAAKPTQAQKQQAEQDRKAQHVQEEAAKKQADLDRKAQHLQEEAAKKQAELERKAQKISEHTAKEQAKLDDRAQEISQQSQTTPVAAAPQPAAAGKAPSPKYQEKAARHQAKEQAKVEHKRTELAKHVAHDQAELDRTRQHLADHIAHDQAKLDAKRAALARELAKKQADIARHRAELSAWLARELAKLFKQSLGGPAKAYHGPPARLPTQSAASVVIPLVPTPAAGPPAQAPAPVSTPAPTKQPGPTAPTSTPATPLTEAPAAAVPTGSSPVTSPPIGAVEVIDSADGETGSTDSQRNQIDANPVVPPKRSNPAAVALKPLARAIVEIPRTVWVGMGGLGALALLLVAVSVLQSRRAVRLLAAQRTLRADVATLSSAVMPVVPGALGGLALTVASRPAEGPASGGDFHDAFELTDGRAAVVVGDVAGRGRDAVAATVLVRHTLRAYLEAGLEPRTSLATAGAVLADRHEGLLATAVVAVHDSFRSTLTLASAGHVPPIVVGGVGHRPVAVAWPAPLGAGVPTGRRQTTLPLPPGTTVCLFTDGATEARRGDGRVGSDELATWLRDLGPDATADDVLACLEKNADALDDDVTICVLRSTGAVSADATPELVEELAVAPGEGPTLIRFLIACGVSPARAAELAVRLEQAPERAMLVAEVRISEKASQARLRPARPAMTVAA